jgi:hypothetical protein
MSLAAGVDLKQVSVKSMTQFAGMGLLGSRLAASRSNTDSSS